MASENFTKNIVCASEILHSLGYHTYFIKGADLNFQGTRGFLRQRGYDEIKGRDEILAVDPWFILTNGVRMTMICFVWHGMILSV